MIVGFRARIYFHELPDTRHSTATSLIPNEADV
jgi:hypothetical protein